MLRFLIAVSKSSDASTELLRPLSARSLALSVLLGSHPPQMPARALVDLARLFGIAGGTMRTALSRSVANGEIVAEASQYRLTERLLERQRAQDAGRRSPPDRWDGRWHTVIAATDQRGLADRRRFRSVMDNHRFGELRPDIWMRPANLAAPAAEHDWIVTTAHVRGIDADQLAGRLWDRPAIGATARNLLDEMDRCRNDCDWADVTSIPELFVVSAAVVRFLRSDPQLPVELTPADSPVAEVRHRYDRFEHDHQQLLQHFLRSS